MYEGEARTEASTEERKRHMRDHTLLRRLLWEIMIPGGFGKLLLTVALQVTFRSRQIIEQSCAQRYHRRECLIDTML